MKAPVVTKLVGLVLMLILVLFTIRQVNPQSMQGFFDAMGVQPGTSDSPGLQPGNRPTEAGEERFNICKTRVHAIVWPDGKRVEEQRKGLDLKWMAHDPQPREIGYLDVEKWLSNHCQIAIRPEATAPADELKTYLTLRYINDSEMVIRVSEGKVFQIGDRNFKSPDLEEAVRELELTAQLTSTAVN